MSDNSNQIRDILPGGPDPQPNITGEPNELFRAPDGQPAFIRDRVIDKDPFATPTKVEDTLTGATSADVHNGLGHPGSGMASSELRPDGQHGRKTQSQGTDQWGEAASTLKRDDGERTHDFQV